MMISKVRPIQARILAGQKGPGLLIFVETKAEPEKGNRSERLRSGRALEISDRLTSRISAKAKVIVTVEIAGVTSHSEKVVRVAPGISLFIRDQKALPAFQNP